MQNGPLNPIRFDTSENMARPTKLIYCTNPDCGIPVDPVVLDCPKCNTSLHEAFCELYYEIDVAHDGQTWEQARHEIEEGLNEALLYRYRGLKVIHGYGSSNRKRNIIAREARHLLHKIAESKGYQCRPDRYNPGAHLLNFEDP